MKTEIVSNARSKAMKAAMWATIPAAFMLSKGQSSNAAGAFFKAGEHFVHEYIKTQIIGAGKLSPEDAIEKLNVATDQHHFFDTQPKVAIALGIRAANGDKEFEAAIMNELNILYYDGVGVRYEDVEKTMKEDIAEVYSILLDKSNGNDKEISKKMPKKL
jgi:hypothetical protein